MEREQYTPSREVLRLMEIRGRNSVWTNRQQPTSTYRLLAQYVKPRSSSYTQRRKKRTTDDVLALITG